MYSNKRQQFLIDQGYAFKVITHLQGLQTFPNLVFRTPGEQASLLAEIRAASVNDALMEEDEKDNPETPSSGYSTLRASEAGGKAQATRRVGNTLASLSGADDMAYLEYKRTANPLNPASGQPSKKMGSSAQALIKRLGRR